MSISMLKQPAKNRRWAGFWMERFLPWSARIPMFKRLITDFAGGTAYITDVGMTGPYDGIIGVDKDAVLSRFLTALPERFDVPKKGRMQFSGVFIELDDNTGLARRD